MKKYKNFQNTSLPEVGKLYTNKNITIPVWNSKIFEKNKVTINTEKDLITRLSPKSYFCILEYKIIKKQEEKNLLYCKILTDAGKVGTFCIFEENFISWIDKLSIFDGL